MFDFDRDQPTRRYWDPHSRIHSSQRSTTITGLGWLGERSSTVTQVSVQAKKNVSNQVMHSKKQNRWGARHQSPGALPPVVPMAGG